MPETPVPEASLELEHPTVAAGLQRARSSLVARPPAHALDVAQGVLMPVLHSLGIDVFDLNSFRLDGDLSVERAEYRLTSEEFEARFVTVPAEAPLPALVSNSPAAIVASNGHSWRGRAVGEEREQELELFDETFPSALLELLRGKAQAPPKSGSKHRTTDSGEEAHDTGEKTPVPRSRRKEFVPAGPLERITLEEVRGYAEAVRNMRGKLQVWFDGENVDITSRSAFYYVLAELALRHGREDAIPGEDLIRPPDEPPSSRRARPLARDGWQLLVDHESAIIEQHTRTLLEALGISRLFGATQRGEPYPAQ